MIPTYLIDHSFSAVHFLAGFILMALSAIYYIGDLHMYKIVSQVFDIFGLVALVIAVEKVT